MQPSDGEQSVRQKLRIKGDFFETLTSVGIFISLLFVSLWPVVENSSLCSEWNSHCFLNKRNTLLDNIAHKSVFFQAFLVLKYLFSPFFPFFPLRHINLYRVPPSAIIAPMSSWSTPPVRRSLLSARSSWDWRILKRFWRPRRRQRS